MHFLSFVFANSKDKTSVSILARTIITFYTDKNNDKIKSFFFYCSLSDLDFFAEITGGSN